MNLSKNLVNSLTFGTLLAGMSLTMALATTSNIVLAVENAKIGGNGYQCLGGEANRWKTESDPSAVLPSGYTITKVVVKAGQNCVEVYPTNTQNSCYTVNVNGTNITVTKIGTGKTCKDISHLEGTYSYVSTPTATPTPTCTPTPTDSYDQTPTPTEEPTSTPTREYEQNEYPTPTPTTEVTPTPTEAVSTPTPTPGSGTSIVQSSTGTNINTTPSVPAQSMAPTGNFGSIASTVSLLIGGLLSSFAFTGYAKKEKNN